MFKLSLVYCHCHGTLQSIENLLADHAFPWLKAGIDMNVRGPKAEKMRSSIEKQLEIATFKGALTVMRRDRVCIRSISDSGQFRGGCDQCQAY